MRLPLSKKKKGKWWPSYLGLHFPSSSLWDPERHYNTACCETEPSTAAYRCLLYLNSITLYLQLVRVLPVGPSSYNVRLGDYELVLNVKQTPLRRCHVSVAILIHLFTNLSRGPGRAHWTNPVPVVIKGLYVQCEWKLFGVAAQGCHVHRVPSIHCVYCMYMQRKEKDICICIRKRCVSGSLFFLLAHLILLSHEGVASRCPSFSQWIYSFI